VRNNALYDYLSHINYYIYATSAETYENRTPENRRLIDNTVAQLCYM